MTRLSSVRIENFRSVRDLSFRPGEVSSLVGEAGAGKSNLLKAVWALLDPEAAKLTRGDLAGGGEGPIKISGLLADDSAISIGYSATSGLSASADWRPPVLFLPAQLRAGKVVANAALTGPTVRDAMRIFEKMIPKLGKPAMAQDERPSTEAARRLVDGLEAIAHTDLGRLVILIEEPELFLPPQLQRYLYRLLRSLADNGNQVLYSTHSPAFLNVTRLEELVLLERHPEQGTRANQPRSIPSNEEFRAYSEFDAERSELFLARAAILVEGLTEKLALPFVFQALGHDADREQISIIECGGKSNIPLVAGIAKVIGIPALAVHDRDAPVGERPIESERHLNQLIEEVVGRNRVVELAPDFEAVAGFRARQHKPGHAWRNFAHVEQSDVPGPLARVVQLALELARE